MSPRGRSSRARGVLLAAGLVAAFIPSIALMPLGGLWLYEHGYLVWWAVGALLFVAAAVGLLWFLVLRVPATRREDRRPAAVTVAAASEDASEIDPHWSPIEERAWAEVRSLARSIDIDRLDSATAFIDLGRETIETVARRLHEGRSDASLRFTLPEALAISERVSRRMSRFAVEHIPLSDRLTVAQIWSIYRWRSAIGVAERLYDVWRVLRLANPATALTNEARERLSRAVLKWGREHVTRRLSEAFVEEVGRAAIDLYGGRLRIEVPAADAGEETGGQGRGIILASEPLRLLIAGGQRANRAALAARLTAGAKLDSGSAAQPPPSLEISFTAEEERNAAAARRLAGPMAASDCIVWIVDGGHGAGAFDETALATLVDVVEAEQHRRLPPVVVVVEGAPSGSAEAVPEVARLGAAARGRSLVTTVVPVSGIDSSEAADQVAKAVAACAPEARRAQIARRLTGLRRDRGILKSGRQAISAAATSLGSLLSGRSR